MKNPRFPGRTQPAGFALVITLTLMVLLTVLAIGLLGLSAIELRSSNHAGARSVARANARLALMLALGDLQKHAGPDTRITATAGTLGDSLPRPQLAGVWNARKLNPTSPDGADRQTDAAKAADFRKWLVSHAEPSATRDQEFPKSPASDGTLLLSRKVVGDPLQEVRADRVELGNTPGGTASGGFAYAVFDEGVKARANLGRETPTGNLGKLATALGGGQMPGLDRIDGLTVAAADRFDLATAEGEAQVAKMVSIGESELGHAAPRGDFGKRFHDLTAHSAGLMTKVTTGGLKDDLNLLAEKTTLPAEFAGKKLYETTWGVKVPSDPTWQQTFAHANVFQGKDSKNKAYLKSTGGVPTLVASAPSNWNAGTGVVNAPATPSKTPPTGPVLMPAIAKVQIVFSLVARDIYHYPKGGFPNDTESSYNELHNPWGRKFAGSAYDYLLHLLNTPVITLHNPYNTAIEFTNLKIEFVNLPFALQVYRNGIAQSTDLVPLGRMSTRTQTAQTKRFGITLSNKSSTGTPTSSPIRMLPGEVKVFSPYIPPTLTWASEAASQQYFFDWRNENESDGRVTGTFVDTSKIRAIPGWPGDGIGFDFDWFAPSGYTVSTDEIEGTRKMDRGSCIGLRRLDEIHVEFAPLPDPDLPDKRFTVEMTLVGANANTKARTSVIDFNYENNDGLRKTLLGTKKSIRYPAEGTINTMQLHEHSTTQLRDYKNAKPFALFSAYAKTTHGAFDPSTDDGLHPAKPWVFHNHTGAVSSQKVVSEHPSHHSHEINLIRLDGSTDDVIDIQPGTDRGNFVTGHTVFNGRRFGTLFDVPLGPIQSPVSLNFANLGTSFYLPRFTAPIGNSYAHPLMSTSAVLESATAGTYADHSYLLNSLFFDGFYCSGLQSRGGPFGDGQALGKVAEDFLSGEKRLPDPRFQPYLAGSSVDQALARITGSDGYRSAAAHQLLLGAFNVNSTSVEAWKAVLSAMSGDGARVSAIPVSTGTGTAESLVNLDKPGDAKGALFSRFRLPNSQAESGDPHALWHGPRELTESELDRLAAEIVKQVRERGPFLSMGEFVNRQLGGAEPNTLAGALQVAIDKAGLNGDADLGGYMIDAARVASLKLKTPAALTGPSAQGAPGYLTQADILSMLGNSATVRSDTFTIRAYGEALDGKGEVEARAWCEAVVQRVPDFVDPADAAETRPADLKREANKTFGRRFAIQSFRWLGAGEI